MFERQRKEVINDDEARSSWGPGPGVLIWNLRRGAHRNSRVGKEGRGPLRPKRREVHGREVHEEIHLKSRVFLKCPRRFEQRLAAEDHGGIAPVRVGGLATIRETIFDSLNKGSGIHGSNTGPCIAGLSSGAGRWPPECWSWILAWSLSKPSRTYSGRG